MQSQYEETFTSTILLNLSLVIIVLLAFGVLKLILPQIYMPLQSSTSNKWFLQTLNIKIHEFLKRGNLAVLFVLFQKIILYFLLQAFIVLLLILVPTYFLGSNQLVPQFSLWSRLQITSLEDNSVDIFIPFLVCLIICFLGIEMYKNFNHIFVDFKQLILKRPAPQNYVMMLDNLPTSIQNVSQLKQILDASFPQKISNIIPIPRHSQRIQFYFYLLKFNLRIYQNNINTQQQYQNKKILVQRKKNTLIKRAHLAYLQLKIASKIHQVQKASLKLQKYKDNIMQIANQEQYQVDYLNYVKHMCPDFPQPVQIEFLRKNNLDFPQPQDKMLILQQPLHRSCFIIFNSQYEASLAANSSIFKDNTQPSVSLAPHQDQILWYNISSTKSQKIASYLIFWILLMMVFVGYFVPQAYILQLASQNQQQMFDFFYNNICIELYKCQDFDINSYKMDQLKCYSCFQMNKMIVTFIPQFISAIFMSCLPQILTLLMYIPKFKSKTQRNNMKFICLFVFLCLIQGILHILLGAAINEQGILNFQGLLDLSMIQVFNKISQNLSQSSFIFSNYVMTKYLLLGIFNIIRLPDILLVIYRKIFLRKSKRIVRTYVFFEFQYITQLAYISHMIVIGLMYAVVSPIAIFVVFIALIGLILTTRYNVFYVYPQYPSSDLSAETDIMKLVISSCYYGFYLMLISCFSYYFSLNHGWIQITIMIFLVIQLILMIQQKYIIDQKFKKSVQMMNKTNYETSTFTTISKKYSVENISYIQKTSILYNEYITLVGNKSHIKEYDITQKEANNISCMYTHPGIVLSVLYPQEEDNDLII